MDQINEIVKVGGTNHSEFGIFLITVTKYNQIYSIFKTTTLVHQHTLFVSHIGIIWLTVYSIRHEEKCDFP